MKRSYFVLSWALVVVGAGAVYACSDDDPVPSSSSSGGLDGGGGTDTGTLTDTGTGTVTKKATVTILPQGDAGTTTGSGTFTQAATGDVTFNLNVTNAPSGSRGVHVHVNGSCNPPGGHFNPNMAGTGEFKVMVVADAGGGKGPGSLTDTKAAGGITVDPLADGGTGIIGRTIVVHGIQSTYLDGGPVLNEAGAPVPPPVDGCGVITASQ